MGAYILGQNLEVIAPLNVYSSLIWSERYYKFGEFELETITGSETDMLTDFDSYIVRDDSDMVMIIEAAEIESDAEKGSMIVKSGRSLESILERRIIWNQTTLDTDLETAVYTLLYNNVMAGAAAERRIGNFTMRRTGVGSEHHVTAQYTGDNLYDVISALCQSFNVGFKITLEGDQFVFSMYRGTDRSYDQDENPYVTFSSDFDNLYNSNYFKDKQKHKNVALIAGEGEGTARKTTVVGTTRGLQRRELYVDARDLSQNLDDSDTSTHVSDADYLLQLAQRGNEKLDEYKIIETFEGEIEVTRMYKYKEDFFMGDLVQIENEHGVTVSTRIIEMMITEDEDGVSYVPTFA